MKQVTLIFAFSAFLALNAFGQYFSKTYEFQLGGGSFSALCIPYGTSFISINMYVCSNGLGCMSISKIDNKGIISCYKEKNYLNGNFRVCELRNDTIFYSSRNNSFPDSTYYWYFGMMTVNGDSIAEYKIPMIHAKYGNATNYGLTLTGGKEAILWGEGIDKRMPNPKGAAYRSVFIRIGFDGSIPRGIFWHEPNLNDYRRMSDAATDLDGNVVFVNNYVSDIKGNFNGFFKIFPNDSIVKVREVESYNFAYASPKMAIDRNGNYYTAVQTYAKVKDYDISYDEVQEISRVNLSGMEEWRKIIPPFDCDWWGNEVIQDMKVKRISICQNGDILAVGSCFIKDSLYKTDEDTIVLAYGYPSFMVRMTQQGDVVWRHIIVDVADNYLVRYTSLHDIREAEDGSIYVAGALGRKEGREYDSWVMRLSPDGCLEDTCTYFDKYWYFPKKYSATTDLKIGSLPFYPNPGTDILHISLPSEGTSGELLYTIYDISGKPHLNGRLYDGTSEIDTSALPSGIYIVTVTDSTGKHRRGKWVKM